MSTSRLPVASPRIVLRYFGRSLRSHPYLLTGALLAPIGLQLAQLAQPWFLREFFNYLVETPGTVPQATFVQVISIIGFLMFFSWTMRRARGWTMVYVEAQVMEQLTIDAFSGLVRHSHHFFAGQFSGTLTRRITKYRDAFETLFDVLTMTAIPLVFFIGGAAIIMTLRNTLLGTIFVLWCAGILWMQYKLAKWRQPLREERSAEDSAVVGAVADAITNQSAIALFSGTRFEIARLAGVVARLRAAIIRSWMADENIWAVQGLLMVGLNIGMLYGTYHFWSLGKLTVGDFVLIQSYVMATFDQIFSINRDLRRVYDVFADAGEMAGILEKPLDVEDPRSPHTVRDVRGEVHFEDVSFHYRAADPILSHLTLTLRPGEKVALVGPSGAGKSTVTKLMLRLYDVSEGSVQIDGVDVRALTQDALRDQIGFVPQDPTLFHRTLMENIRYGRRDASDEEVIEAAKKAHCHEFIMRLSHGYDTYVGERGIKLSGGERQRVAIARAMLKNAPILILDEATSSLDSESEALIQDSLATLMQGKTALVIAHRLSTIMKMDRIVVLEAGEVVAQGTHGSLLKEDGLYKKLWSIQAGGFLGDE